MAKAAKKAPSKTEILSNIATATDLPKKKVAEVLEALTAEIKKNLSSRGPGIFALHGLVKIEKKKVPARPPQKNWMNPFTKQLEDRPAKPASVKVKVRALRALKDMVA
jgi:nucleoid DNA-binding protein